MSAPRQQRRKNRPSPSQLVGIQPQLLLPSSLALLDPVTVELEFPAPVWIGNSPSWQCGSANAVSWIQSSPSIVAVTFDAAIPAEAKLVIPAWDRTIRGTEGQWIGALDQVVYSATPTPPALCWLNGAPVASGGFDVFITTSTTMQTPSFLTMLRTSGGTLPTAVNDTGGGTSWVLTYPIGINIGDLLFQDAYSPDWLGSSGEFLAPGAFWCRG